MCLSSTREGDCVLCMLYVAQDQVWIDCCGEGERGKKGKSKERSKNRRRRRAQKFRGEGGAAKTKASQAHTYYVGRRSTSTRAGERAIQQQQHPQGLR